MDKDVQHVIMLGTGDPLSDERAQSSLAFPIGGDETLLVDTSSGTILLRQLRDAGLALAGIRHVFITHRHFDHAGGLAPLLVALLPVPGAHVTVYAPPQTLAALHDILRLTIPGVEDWLGHRLRWQVLSPGVLIEAGAALVTPFEVDHGLECVGFRVERRGSIVVFGADTRPCPTVAAFARGADLLIHEAYGPERATDEAHAFGHSAGCDAGMAARGADVPRLLLTHFRNRRYADPAALAAEAGSVFAGRVEVAVDLAVIDV